MPLEQYSFGAGNVYAIPQGTGIVQPIRFGTVQESSCDFEYTMKPLMGANNFPVDVARAAGKITGKIKSAKFQASAFNAAFFGQSLATGKIVQVTDEGGPAGQAIPAAVILNTTADTPNGLVLPFAATTAVVVGTAVSGTGIAAGAIVVSKTSTTVTLSLANTADVPSGTPITFGPSITVMNAAGFIDDLGVLNGLSGAQFTKVTSAPVTGQYAVTAGGTYIFSTADGAAGVPVLLSYEFAESTTGNRITGYNQLRGPSPSVKLVLGNSYNGLGTTLVLYRAKFSKLPLDFKNEDWTIPEMDYECYQDATGRVFDWSSDQ